MRRSLALMAVAAACLMAACSSTTKPKPTPLADIKPAIAGRMVWNQKIDGVDFPLAIASIADGFIVAANDGRIVALGAGDGHELWRGDAGAKIAAGVGSDGRYAAVVTRDNELVVLDRGKLVWRSALASRVTTPPLVAGERVFVIGVDRVVLAFDAQDGRKLWTLQRPGDALTLAQRSVLAAFKDTLIAAQGSRLAGIDPLNGSVRWEVPVATPRGTNEVERLADLIGPMGRTGDVLCVRAFQSAVGCVDAGKGSLAWAKNTGGALGIAADEERVYAADASDRITAWRLGNGDTAWTSDRFLHRGLSAPLTVGKMVVFGDGEGQMLFLSRDSGDMLLHLPTDGSPVAAPPMLAGTTILAVTRKGGVYAFRPD